MSSSEEPTFPLFSNTESQINSFIRHLNSSKRILALCGAGLSASAPSNIPTFKGSGALWKNHKAASLSSIEAFEANPGLVWSYFADRRRLALRAEVNDGHKALAALARKKSGFVCLTQNIDGLSHKAKHPKDRLYELHGSLLHIKCTNKSCDYVDSGNRTEPLCPALAGNDNELSSFSSKLIVSATDTTRKAAVTSQLASLSLDSKENTKTVEQMAKQKPVPKYERNPNPLEAILESLAPTITLEMQVKTIPTSNLPHCSKCSSLLRPGVVWFGESLSQSLFDEINSWIDKEKKLDLMLVIGTRAEVFPAARFVTTAREKGARIAVIDMGEGGEGEVMGECGGVPLREKKDWKFVGDAAEVLRVLFQGVLEN